MRRQGKENFIHQQNVLEVVDDALSIEEVHGCREEIPVEGLGEAEVLLLARNVGDGDNFLERNNLNGSHQDDDIDMTGEQGDKKAGDHHKCPYRPGNESLFLLLVLGLLRLLWKSGKKATLAMANAQNHINKIYSYLLRYRSRMRGIAIFAWAGGLRGAITDVGGHAHPPLAAALEPNIAARLGHDRRKRKKGEGRGRGEERVEGVKTRSEGRGRVELASSWAHVNPKAVSSFNNRRDLEKDRYLGEKKNRQRTDNLNVGAAPHPPSFLLPLPSYHPSLDQP